MERNTANKTRELTILTDDGAIYRGNRREDLIATDELGELTRMDPARADKLRHVADAVEDAIALGLSDVSSTAPIGALEVVVRGGGVIIRRMKRTSEGLIASTLFPRTEDAIKARIAEVMSTEGER